jgi:hypothetical protein
MHCRRCRASRASRAESRPTLDEAPPYCVEAENEEPQQSKYWTVNRKAEEWLAEILRSLKLNRSVCGTLSYLVHLADLPEIVYCSQKHDNNGGTQHESRAHYRCQLSLPTRSLAF